MSCFFLSLLKNTLYLVYFGPVCPLPRRPRLLAAHVSHTPQLSPQDDFVVLACDGIFDVLTSEEVVSDVYDKMKLHADAQR